MPTFTVTGDIDPFLHVALNYGESVFCESDAMVMMEDTLDLEGRMQGGMAQALMRRFANGESFFQQHIKATRGDGDCLLSPTLPGAMEVLDIGQMQYRLSDGVYVAASSGVSVAAKFQGLGNAMFGGTGGFMVGETSGQGQCVVSGFGALFTLEVKAGRTMTIDNGHVVAWERQLSYESGVGTAKNQGLIAGLVNSATSGEGLVLRFSGVGKIVVCSRNRDNFVTWLSGRIASGR
jgi:uncharacterized protein (TIGR00266 family)